MKYRMKSILSVALAAAMTLTLSACGAKKAEGIAISGESLDVNGIALRPDGEAGLICENNGFRLVIPLEYNELLNVTPGTDGDENGVLFAVSEKASVEAAEKQGYGGDGYGELFAIGRITKDDLNKRLCYDMSGQEVFAQDADGNCYMFYHPTDVRFYRETTEQMTKDQEQWTKLNGWARGKARDSFLAENAGLTAVSCDNSEISMFLARAAYMDGANYTLSTTAFGPLAPKGVDAAPFVEKLLQNVTVEPVDSSETPDGEYVVLYFTDDDYRFDFFRMEGKENYCRQTWLNGENEQLYKLTFADGTIKASEVMQAWYDALVEANGLSKGGITKEMAYEGVSNYCRSTFDWSVAKDNPDIMYVEMGEESETAYRVIFRSYTGAFVYFDVDKATGTTKMTEYVPDLDIKIEAGTFNLFDYRNG